MKNKELAVELAKLIVIINQKGWSAATGTNYSFRDETHYDQYWVSVSGIDKAYFQSSDFMHVTLNGEVLPEFNHLKPSAENKLHALIYERSNAKVILHSHSVYGTILSQLSIDKGTDVITIAQYEVQKAIKGITTHECQLLLPVVKNNQDMDVLRKNLTKRWDACDKATGFAIANHGLYTWGQSLAEAKRHLEAYEFLFECVYKKLMLTK